MERIFVRKGWVKERLGVGDSTLDAMVETDQLNRKQLNPPNGQWYYYREEVEEKARQIKG